MFFCRWTAQIKLPIYFPFNITFILTKPIKIFVKKSPQNLSNSSIFLLKINITIRTTLPFCFDNQQTQQKGHKTHIGCLKSLNIDQICIYLCYKIWNFCRFFLSTNVTFNRKCSYWKFDLGGSPPAEWHTLLITL